MPVHIFDPDIYVDGPPHDELERLRRDEPISWQPLYEEGDGCWAVLRHGDVVHVAREARIFSAEEGGVVVEDLAPEQLAMMRNMLLAMDPPRHQDYRRPLAPSFTRTVIGGMEERIRTICREIMETAREKGEVEFVHEVCALLPSQVIGELMGLPREDWPRIHEMAERNTSGQDPDVSGYDTVDDTELRNASMEMAMYAIQFAAARRSEPVREDLTSLILGSDFGGKEMTDIDFGSFFVQMVTAGNDTTKTMLSAGLAALLDHPDQLAALREDHSRLHGAVEEILRWANPLHYFRRTAMAPVELHGAKIESGQKVAMFYTSANRDDAVFADPHAFDIRRDPNPHLSFGIGEHFCLGAHLARLEGRMFFEELLSAFGKIEQTGPAKRVRSNLNNALKSLPVRLAA